MLDPNFNFHDTALYANTRDANWVTRNKVVDGDEDTLKPERQPSLTPVNTLDPTNGKSTNVYSRLEQRQQEYMERKGTRRGSAFSPPKCHDFDSRPDHTAEQEPGYDVVDDLLQKWTTVVI